MGDMVQTVGCTAWHQLPEPFAGTAWPLAAEPTPCRGTPFFGFTAAILVVVRQLGIHVYTIRCN